MAVLCQTLVIAMTTTIVSEILTMIEHGNGGTVSNIGDSHDNHHCVGNSNNDKGIVCYINTDLFC